MKLIIKSYSIVFYANVKTFHVYDTGFNSTAIKYIVEDIEAEVNRVNTIINGSVAHSHNGYVVLTCNSVSPDI